MNAQDVDGRTPLIRAAEVGHWTVIGDLLSYNADDTILDNNGNSALDCAEQRLGYPLRITTIYLPASCWRGSREAAKMGVVFTGMVYLCCHKLSRLSK